MDVDDLGRKLDEHIQSDHDFFTRFEEKFDTHIAAQAERHTEVCQRLTAIETSNAGMPKRVASLESSRDRMRGGMWVLGILWTALIGAGGYVAKHWR